MYGTERRNIRNIYIPYIRGGGGGGVSGQRGNNAGYATVPAETKQHAKVKHNYNTLQESIMDDQ